MINVAIIRLKITEELTTQVVQLSIEIRFGFLIMSLSNKNQRIILELFVPSL